VRQGQVLARVVDVDYRAAVAQAQARVLSVIVQGQALDLGEDTTPQMGPIPRYV
jgi:multidrug resistance efflux pump